MKKELILTIDDAPSSNFRAKVDFLLQHEINAVFFCIGNKIEPHTKDLIYAVQHGFILGNHSYSHPYFSSISSLRGIEELQKTDELLAAVYAMAGVREKERKRYFRFPYGDTGDGRFGLHQKGKTRALIEHVKLKKNIYTYSDYANIFLNTLITNTQQKYNTLQDQLIKMGYDKNALLCNADLRYYKNASGVDWQWSYDTRDWALPNMKKSHVEKELLNQIEACLISKKSAIYNSKSEIILCHDYDYNYDFFRNLVIRIKNLDFTFSRLT